VEWNISKPKLPLENLAHHDRGEIVSAVSPLIASTGLLRLACFLASYPGPCAECSAHGRGVYVHVDFNITVRETTALLGLLAGSASRPFRIMHQVDCHLMEQRQTQIISTSTHSSLATCS